MSKRAIVLWLLVIVASTSLMFWSNANSADNKTTPKKFKVTFTVVYNELTLEQAAEKEKQFRDNYRDACNVDIKLEDLKIISGQLQFYVQPNGDIFLNTTPGTIDCDSSELAKKSAIR